MSEDRQIYWGKELVSASRCIVDLCEPGTCNAPRLPDKWYCEAHLQEWMRKRDESIREHVKRHNIIGAEAKYYNKENESK